MSYESKMDSELELILQYYQSFPSVIFSANTGTNLTGEWELIVKYHGDIQTPVQTVGARAEILNESFATVLIEPSKIINFLSFFEIEYVSLPKRMFYIIRESYGKACLTNVHNVAPYNLRGQGVLLGIIDSGITYTHPDFRNEDGTTRIAYLWDQTISGNPPVGFSLGAEYTREQINEALRQPTIEETLTLVPSIDEIGHGTAVAGVAGGNGRVSQGIEVGVAPEAEFIIVKVGTQQENSFPRTIEVMKGIKYATEKAMELDRPIAINIGFGMVQGGHDGRTLLELFIDQMVVRWKSTIVVGTGNQGNQANHTAGIIEAGGTKEIQFIVGSGQVFYGFNLWKSFIDVFEIKITSPSGEETDRLKSIPTNQFYRLGRTNIFINFSQPSNINIDEEILVYMESDNQFVDPGIWTLTVYGIEVTNGSYNIWGATEESTGGKTSFVDPISSTTLTIPSTSFSIVGTGAFNPITNQIAAFSGRGFTRDNRVQPSIVAPGVNIMTANNQGSYSLATGTSIASAFVAGGAAILMEWGVVKGNDPFLYGDRLTAYLLRNTIRLAPSLQYPNPLWGYGAFCLEGTLKNLIGR